MPLRCISSSVALFETSNAEVNLSCGKIGVVEQLERWMGGCRAVPHATTLSKTVWLGCVPAPQQ